MNPIGQRGIDAHLRELDQDGLTILPPSLVNVIAPECAGLPERLRETLVRLESEGKAIGTDEATAVDAPLGSLLVFDGHLWHGTWPRSTPGDRLGVHCFFAGTSRLH